MKNILIILLIFASGLSAQDCIIKVPTSTGDVYVGMDQAKYAIERGGNTAIVRQGRASRVETTITIDSIITLCAGTMFKFTDERSGATHAINKAYVSSAQEAPDGTVVIVTIDPGVAFKTVESAAALEDLIVACGGGGSLEDGDKGDIVVSGGGATWRLDDDAPINDTISHVYGSANGQMVRRSVSSIQDGNGIYSGSDTMQLGNTTVVFQADNNSLFLEYNASEYMWLSPDYFAIYEGGFDNYQEMFGGKISGVWDNGTWKEEWTYGTPFPNILIAGSDNFLNFPEFRLGANNNGATSAPEFKFLKGRDDNSDYDPRIYDLLSSGDYIGTMSWHAPGVDNRGDEGNDLLASSFIRVIADETHTQFSPSISLVHGTRMEFAVNQGGQPKGTYYKITLDSDGKLYGEDSSFGSADSLAFVNKKYVDALSGSGEANTASNAGSGEGVFKQKAGVDLEFKTLSPGSNVTITPEGDSLVFESKYIADDLAAGTAVYPVLTGDFTLQFGDDIDMNLDSIRYFLVKPRANQGGNDFLARIGDANHYMDVYKDGVGTGYVQFKSPGGSITLREAATNVDFDLPATSTSNFVFTDSRTAKTGAPILYAADYSANYTARSIPDWGSVQNYVGTALNFDSLASLTGAVSEFDELYIRDDGPNEVKKITYGEFSKDRMTVEFSTNTTANSYALNLADVSAGILTVSPPASPSKGMWFTVCDSRANSAANNISVDFLTDKLHGTSQTYVINTNGDAVRFTYVDTTVGWVISK